MSGSPLAAWIGFCPSMTMYPGGKVMTALALLLHEPAWHAAEGYIAGADHVELGSPGTDHGDPGVQQARLQADFGCTAGAGHDGFGRDQRLKAPS
jgi:hypothetical protein